MSGKSARVEQAKGGFIVHLDPGMGEGGKMPLSPAPVIAPDMNGVMGHLNKHFGSGASAPMGIPAPKAPVSPGIRSRALSAVKMPKGSY